MRAGEDWHDVIVVGAGIGGLTAAARLVREGLSVLVLDRRGYPGGTASVYLRGGYTFPCGPLGFSSPGIVGGVLGALGADEGFGRCRVGYRVLFSGVSARLSLPFDELAAELARAFPSERGGIDAFFADAGKTAAELRSACAEKRRVRLPAGLNLPASVYLEERVGDPALRSILGTIGTTEPVFGFPLLAAMWDLMGNEGIWYPEGGFTGLGKRLASLVKSSGRGEMRSSSEVARIAVEGGAARGVELADGTRLGAGAVVSNADFKTTFLKLVDEDELPAEWRAAVEAARQTASNIQVSLGIDASGADLSAFEGSSRLIYRSGEEGPVDWGASEVDPTALASGELEVCLWSADDQTLAPRGGASVVIRTGAEHAHFERFRLPAGRRSAGYAEYKERLGKALVGEVASVLPGLEKAVRVTDVATPLTFEDMGGRYHGAVAGWSQSHSDAGSYDVRDLVLTPVRGLYMAGYQALSWLMLGGVPTAAVSGIRAAEALLSGEAPVSEVTLP